jgi:glycosyltransferase involved in cell wall biosynthesis
VTGLLVPVEDSDAMAEAFIKLAAEQTFREELGKRGQELALREYNWASIGLRYLELLFPHTLRQLS